MKFENFAHKNNGKHIYISINNRKMQVRQINLAFFAWMY